MPGRPPGRVLGGDGSFSLVSSFSGEPRDAYGRYATSARDRVYATARIVARTTPSATANKRRWPALGQTPKSWSSRSKSFPSRAYLAGALDQKRQVVAAATRSPRTIRAARPRRRGVSPPADYPRGGRGVAAIRLLSARQPRRRRVSFFGRSCAARVRDAVVVRPRIVPAPSQVGVGPHGRAVVAVVVAAAAAAVVGLVGSARRPRRAVRRGLRRFQRRSRGRFRRRRRGTDARGAAEATLAVAVDLRRGSTSFGRETKTVFERIFAAPTDYPRGARGVAATRPRGSIRVGLPVAAKPRPRRREDNFPLGSSTTHAPPASHGPHSSPPQSTSLSEPSRTPFAHWEPGSAVGLGVGLGASTEFG